MTGNSRGFHAGQEHGKNQFWESCKPSLILLLLSLWVAVRTGAEKSQKYYQFAVSFSIAGQSPEKGKKIPLRLSSIRHRKTFWTAIHERIA